MEFRILGPLQVLEDGEPLPLGGERRRALLAALVLRRNARVSTEALIEEIWPDPPPSARTVVHGHVSALRRTFGQDDRRLASVDAGYLLRVDDSELDAALFDELFARASRSLAAGEPGEAADLLKTAEKLWSGSALSDTELFGSAASDVAALDDRLAEVIEMRIEASLSIGQGRELIPELLALVRSEPLREPLHGYLATALYRAGRQAEALDVLRELRDRLRDELGIDPGPTIQVLETRILQQSLPLGPERESYLEDGGESDGDEERRRILVTTVVCRLGSEHHPPLEQAEETLRSFGATVEVSGPGRIVGTFGLPMQSEDDALTAVRAALEITRGDDERTRSGEDRARIGVSSGWVTVSGEQIIEARVGARPIRTAATLSLVADAGQIVVTDLVRRVTEPAVSYRSLSRPVPTGEEAFEVLPEIGVGDPGAVDWDPFVGRNQELQLLEWALERAERERQAQLATVVGPPGIGKSSVANALLDRIGAHPNVLRGRCLHYGSGVSSWPIGEIVRAATGILDDDDRSKARARIDDYLGSAEDAAEMSEGVAAIAGLMDQPLRREEIPSVVCRFLAHAANEAPVIVVIDDLHWADSDLLQLLRTVITSSQDVPLFVLCLGRPELLEEHPDWSGGVANAMVVSLGPLSDGEMAVLLDHLDEERVLQPPAVEHLLRLAEGNPMFLIETVRTIREQRIDTIGREGVDRTDVVPPTLQGVLGARLARLDANERRLLARASIIGQEFDTQALAYLLPNDLSPALTELIDRLVQRGLLQATNSLPGVTFRFRHLLIRDAAYMELTSELRAGLHETFAQWDEMNAGERLQEIQEIIGYHLECAHTAHVEAGDSDPEQLAELAVRAARHLSAAGRRSWAAQESRAAANLLGRAAALLPESDHDRPDVLCDWGVALMEFGEWESAHVALAEAIQAAEDRGDVSSIWRARLEEADLRSYRDQFSISASTMISLADEAIAALEPVGDRATHARALELKGDALHVTGQAGLAAEAYRQAGDLAPESRLGEGHAAFGSIDDPAPVQGLIVQLEDQGDSRDPHVLASLAYLYALDDRFGQSRSIAAQALKSAEELGSRWLLASVAMYAGQSFLLQATPDEAERVLRQGIRILESIGDAGMMPTAAALLADAVLEQGRTAEALQWLDRTIELSTEDDVASQVLWRRLRARIDLSRGALDHAWELGTESVERADRTDWLNLRGDAHLGFAHVLSARGDSRAAAREGQVALDAYERKGNRIGAGAAHRFVEINEDVS